MMASDITFYVICSGDYNIMDIISKAPYTTR